MGGASYHGKEAGVQKFKAYVLICGQRGPSKVAGGGGVRSVWHFHTIKNPSAGVGGTWNEGTVEHGDDVCANNRVRMGKW